MQNQRRQFQIKDILQDILLKKNIVKIITKKNAEGIFEDFPPDLDERLSNYFKSNGISSLYSHQKKAYDILSTGKNIVVTTPTASGKSLIYTLYVFNNIISSLNNKKDTRALYIFPTKALSSDQEASTFKITEKIPEIKAYRYDGDTPVSLRQAIRANGNIIITNPDMLHAGILPNHPKWSKFFASLNYIVIDEVHIYRGIFGSHFACLLERLKRILAFYGVKPQFILLSATIANPLEHCQTLTGESCEHLNSSGAPEHTKHFIAYNPPFIPGTNIRKGIVLQSVKIGNLLLDKFQTIHFCPSRLYVELSNKYMTSQKNPYSEKVLSYRGGYLPKERKAIEESIRSKKSSYIITTNALELGIDIGDFSAAILASFPGTISSFFQQSGRAGRKGESVIFLVASNSPLDQFLINNFEYIFSSGIEKALTNPHNPYVYSSHVKCALFELPFAENEQFMKKNPIDVLSLLVDNQIAVRKQNAFYYSDSGYPAEDISLRTASIENFVIINTTDGKNEVIGEMDRDSVYTMLFPKAIYMHRGLIFEVKTLDLTACKAYVEETKTNHYTDSILKSDIKVLREKTRKKTATIQILSEVLIRHTITKFKKIKFFTSENVGYGDINLPSIEIHTEAVFVGFNGIIISFFENKTDLASEAIASLAYLSHNILPLYLFCDYKDIGTADTTKSPYYSMEGFFIYDSIPGGVNLAQEAYFLFPEMFKHFLSLVQNCQCAAGCPGCIGVEYTQLKKSHIIALLEKFL